MNTIEIILPIEPTAQMRSQPFMAGKHASVHKASKQLRAEVGIMDLLHPYVPETPLSGPIILDMVATFVPPQSKPDWWKEAAIIGQIKHTSRPDLDNIVKNIKDCMEKMGFFCNDSQIYAMYATKKYGVQVEWRIKLREVKQPSNKKEWEAIEQNPDLFTM